jgi:hypothetical protein
MLDPRPGAPVVSNPPTSDVQQRWQADRDAIAAVDPWQHSPDRTVMVKQPDGTVVARPRTAADGAPDQAAPGEPPRAGEPELAPRDSSGRIQLTKDIAVTEQELHDLVAHKAQTDSQKLTTPKPGEYQLRFNDDFVLPQGTEWKWDENSPLLTAVREFASANNMSQATFSRLLQMHAASRIGEDMAFAEAKAREVQALGDAANQRVDAVRTWLKAMAPEHFAGLAKVLEMAPTAATVKGLEALMARHVSGGAASFRGSNREPESPNKISQAEYDQLSYHGKLQYAESFSNRGRR